MPTIVADGYIRERREDGAWTRLVIQLLSPRESGPAIVQEDGALVIRALGAERLPSLIVGPRLRITVEPIGG